MGFSIFKIRCVACNKKSHFIHWRDVPFQISESGTIPYCSKCIGNAKDFEERLLDAWRRINGDTSF